MSALVHDKSTALITIAVPRFYSGEDTNHFEHWVNVMGDGMQCPLCGPCTLGEWTCHVCVLSLLMSLRSKVLANLPLLLLARIERLHLVATRQSHVRMELYEFCFLADAESCVPDSPLVVLCQGQLCPLFSDDQPLHPCVAEKWSRCCFSNATRDKIERTKGISDVRREEG